MILKSMSLDPNLQKYYDERLLMMGSQGWKDLMEDMEAMRKATDTLSSVTDEKSLDFRKGELSIINWMLNIRDMSIKAYEELQNE